MAEEETTTTTAPATEAPATAPAAAPAARKRRAKRSVPAGELHIKATFNNTIVTVTDKKGEVITISSAGANGFRGSKKGTAYAAQIASEKALNTAKQNHNLGSVTVYVNGIGQGRDAAIRATQTAGIDVDGLVDKTGVPHGGVRPRKQRKP